MSQMSFSVANQQYVCMQCLLNATDTHQIINIKSKVRMTYCTKQQNQKLFHLTKLYKQRIRKDFVMKISRIFQCQKIGAYS